MIKEKITAAQFRQMSQKTKERAVSKNTKGNQEMEKMCFYFNKKGIPCVKEYAFHGTRKFRFDYAFPQYMIAVEYEGIFSQTNRHRTVTGYVSDTEKYNLATSMGWQVIRVTIKNTSGLINMLEQMIDKYKKEKGLK